MSILSAQELCYSYKTKYQTVQAVKDVTCDWEAGVFYALVGKSGSGKTTLLSLLAGLEKPQSGCVLVDGRDLRELDVDLYRRSRASVIYQSYNLFPLMTVRENVMYPLKLAGVSDADARTRAQDALARTTGSVCPPCCPAASSSALPSPARWPSARKSSSRMSLPAIWIPKTARRSCSCSRGWRTKSIAACWWLRTIRRLQKSRTSYTAWTAGT